jgi:hypothetical protein
MARKNKICWVWRDGDGPSSVLVSPTKPRWNALGFWHGTYEIDLCKTFFRSATGLPLPKPDADPIRVRFSAQVLS